MMKRQLIALGVAVTAPLLGVVAMTAATVAVAYAVFTNTTIHHVHADRRGAVPS
jgi:hypothetical protein